MQESKRCMGHNERCKIYEFDVPEKRGKGGRGQRQYLKKKRFSFKNEQTNVSL